MSNQPPEYTRQYNFENFQTLNPTSPLPGDKVEAELNAARSSVNQTISRLNELQNADGSLKTPGALVAQTTATATSVATSVAETATQAYLAQNYDPTIATQAAASAQSALASKIAAESAAYGVQVNANYADTHAQFAQQQASIAATARAESVEAASDANTSKNEAAALAATVASDYVNVGNIYNSALSLKNWVSSEAYQFVHKREDLADVAGIMLFNDGEPSNTLVGKIFQGASVNPNSLIEYRPPVSGTPGNLDIQSGPWWVEGHDSPEDPHRIVMRDMMSCLVDTWETFGPRVGNGGNLKVRQEGINGSPNTGLHTGPERIKGVNYSKDNFGVGVISGSQPLTPRGYVDEADSALSARIDGKANTSHTHTISNITGLQTSLDGKSSTSHLHTGIYAPISHTHSVGDVSGLQSQIDAAKITQYDNYKIYSTGDLVLADNRFFRFNNFIGAAGYGPITHPGAWTEQSAQPDLSGYVSGASLSQYLRVPSSNPTDTEANSVSSTNVYDLKNSYYKDYTFGVCSGSTTISAYDGWSGQMQDVTVDISNAHPFYDKYVVTFKIEQGRNLNEYDFATGKNITVYLGDGSTTFQNWGGLVVVDNSKELNISVRNGGSPYIAISNLNNISITSNLEEIRDGTGFMYRKGLKHAIQEHFIENNASWNQAIVYKSENGIGFETVPTVTLVDSKLNKNGTGLTGKLMLYTSASAPGINFSPQANAPSSPVAGDMWMAANTDTLRYRAPLTNTTLDVATRNASNTFVQPNTFSSSATFSLGASFNSSVSIDVIGSSGTNALRITQKGGGRALVVEDEVSPDLSAFVVDTNGAVGVGVNPSTWVATNKVEVVGNVKADGIITGSGPVFKVNGTQTHSGGSDTHELLMSINGSTYRIGMRFVSTP